MTRHQNSVGKPQFSTVSVESVSLAPGASLTNYEDWESQLSKNISGRTAACTEAGVGTLRPARPALSGIEGVVIIVVLVAGTVLTTLGQPIAVVIELLGGLVYAAARPMLMVRSGGSPAALRF